MYDYLFKDKIIQNCARKILQEVELNNYPKKSQIYRWVHKFQTTESGKNLKNVKKSQIWHEVDRKMY